VGVPLKSNFPEEANPFWYALVREAQMEIRWPDEYKPENTKVHVRNELLMPGTQVEVVWAWLCRPGLWPTWYSNSAHVVVKNQADHCLRLGSEFRWKTFGVTIDSKVLEFVEHERLAWNAYCHGVRAYHAWAFQRTDKGLYVLTEETQNGWLASVSSCLLPNRMYRWHQRWLESLHEVASRGLPEN